jgi:hypothetical protein
MPTVSSRTVWSLMLPMLVASETVGHALVARFLDPHGERHMVLARTTQDYLEFLYAAIVVCLVLGIAALARRAIATFRGLGPRPLPAWRVAALPSVVFLAQEHVESLVHNGDAGWFITAEPVVLFGAVLQLPFGLMAVWLVRTLLRAAEGLGFVLARQATRVRERAAQLVHGPQVEPVRLLGLARGLAERAPPPSFA